MKKGDAVMTLVGNVKMSKQEFDAIACRFLGSGFTGQIYADWPIDLRLPRPQRDGRTTDLLLNRGICNQTDSEN